jgi:hypothetical protein
MSDFLGRLAQRVVEGSTPRLRPRLPSTYEPTATALAPTSLSEFVETEATADAAAIPSVGAADAARRFADETHAPRERVSARDTVVVPHGVAPEFSPRPSAGAAERTSADGPFAGQGAPLVPGRIEPRRRAPEEDRRYGGAPEGRFASVEELRHAAKELGSRVEHDDATEPARRAGTRRVVTPASVVARPAGRPSREAKRAAASTEAGDGAPTIVRVTIGRVEVRAVTTAAQATGGTAEKKSAASPSLSLADYLRQRRGGRG